MGNVVNLSDHKPHVSGPAKCLGCQHEWAAARPAGPPVYLECPSCGLHKGVFNGNHAPPEADAVYTCACGCQHFFVMTYGVFCQGCGTVTDYSALE